MKVSVNIITRNRPTLLNRAIESVLKQDFADYEIIIVDNSGNDTVSKHVEQYEDERIKLVPCYTQSRGLVKARNAGLDVSKGKYIAVLDDDDVWVRHDKLSLQSGFLDVNKKHVLIGTDIEVVNPQNQVLGKKEYAHLDHDIRDIFLVSNQFCHSTTMFRRQSAIECGGYESVEGMWNTNEYKLWLKLGCTGYVHNMAILSTRYTYWANAYSFNHRAKLYWYDFKMARQFSSKYPNYNQAFKRYVFTYPIKYLLKLKWWQKIDPK